MKFLTPTLVALVGVALVLGAVWLSDTGLPSKLIITGGVSLVIASAMSFNNPQKKGN